MFKRMPPVTRITLKQEIARADVPLDVPRGDSDLLPIAIFLWLCSVVRVALTLLHHQRFDVEATLALTCVLTLPLFIQRARQASGKSRA